LIRALSDRSFDVTAMKGFSDDTFEGHAFSFIHRTYLQRNRTPIVPIFTNTFEPPNQPTPRRCVELGKALRELIASYPQDLRVGVLGSGGLSHFIVQEEMDRSIIEALRNKDTEFLARLDPRELMAGSSEIRNWIVAAAAATDLDLSWVEYIPGYRTPALTGTGLCFASWN
jgi:3-O-methylgallate 3,4-dioxygenase